MYKFFKKCFALTISIISLLFTIIPEKNFEKKVFFEKLSDETNIIVNRIFVIVVVFIISVLLNLIINKLKKKITIKDRNYCIVVEYGDIFSFVDCKKVIPFDECFTTCIGSMPSEIKPNSVCGQYLNKFPINDLQNLIEKLDLKPEKSKSKYNKKDRYASGTLIPKEDFLLLAFAKLDCNGLGRFFTYDEFLDCLSKLWKEIEKYYAQQDVCIPILGSGITRIGDYQFSQQELLDIIINSYILSSNKIKKPYKLRIICQKCEGFSLNKVKQSI